MCLYRATTKPFEGDDGRYRDVSRTSPVTTGAVTRDARQGVTGLCEGMPRYNIKVRLTVLSHGVLRRVTP